MATPGMLYKYMTSETLRKIIENSSLRISKPSDFNDPFDSNFPGFSGKVKVKLMLERMFSKHSKDNGVYKEKLKEFIRREVDTEKFESIIKDAIEDLRLGWDKYIDNYRILCLTPNKAHILMWSHYARYHQGAVLGFDFRSEFFFKEINEVHYNKKDSLIDDIVSEGMKAISDYVLHHPSSFDVAIEQLDSLLSEDSVIEKIVRYAVERLNPSFFKKKYAWNYEDEWRIVRLSSDGEVNFLPFEKASLKEVIFGIGMNEYEKENTINLLSSLNYKAKVFQARKANSEMTFDDITHQVYK